MPHLPLEIFVSPRYGVALVGEHVFLRSPSRPCGAPPDAVAARVVGIPPRERPDHVIGLGEERPRSPRGVGCRPPSVGDAPARSARHPLANPAVAGARGPPSVYARAG
jgi:hypothetical protein